ncbi:MAG: hypothetical protein MUF49_12190 [Oculatellaceae cyanobacterium Prado106]|jgi:predicted RNase H-like HicB family nuclease|nr:hypothetical protein [Oculatellaceae cyanobacterium Prado106]
METVSILLESETQGFRASVLGLSDCQAHGQTREDALTKLQAALQERLKSAKIITLPLHSQSASQFAGIFNDDPQWDEFQAEIASYRKEADAELAAEYLQSDQGSSAA